MNAVQAWIQKWISDNHSSREDLSIRADLSHSYVSHVMCGSNSSITAVAALDHIVHFPPDVLASTMLPNPRGEFITVHDRNALIQSWPIQEKRV